MEKIGALTVPILLSAVSLFASLRGTDVFDAMRAGAAKGLETVKSILPSLVALLAVTGMLRASGALEGITELLTPVFSFLRIPRETTPVLLIRPLSGSGALAAVRELLSRYGPDSLVGYTASVMLGSTETTFYVISVYFGSLREKRTGWVIPAALCADAVGFLTAAMAARLMWNG